MSQIDTGTSHEVIGREILPTTHASTPDAQIDVRRRARHLRRVAMAWRLAIVGAFLLAWEFVPTIPNITNVVVWLDRFFISSPTRVADQILKMMTGEGGATTIWEPLMSTVLTALVGGALGGFTGGLLGLVFSHWETINRVGRPLLTLMNAVPKITIIPIIVLIASSSTLSNGIVAFIIVFFTIFFNAYEGGQSVPKEMLQLSSLLGAGSATLLLKIRGPIAFAWSLGQVPNAIAHGLTGTVTAELFTGSSGIGGILIAAINTQNANLTFAVVVVLGTVGVTLVLLMDLLKRRLLHWW